MSDGSKIEWCEATWSPVTGCDRVSPGCDHCYALTLAKRLKVMGQPKYQRDGDPRTSGPGFGVTVHPDVVNLPLRWRKPRMVFVNPMGDLFHAGIPEPWLAEIFAVMAAARHHTFQVLTKRHARMRSVLNRPAFLDQVWERAVGKGLDPARWEWPLPNIWVGVSAENRKWLGIRYPALFATPAAVRWISAEPLLGPLSFWPDDHTGHDSDYIGEFPYERRTCLDCSGFEDEDPRVPWTVQDHVIDADWVVAGGESGPGARRCELEWLRSLRDQCAEAGVPYFLKQIGSVLGRELGAGPKGGDIDRWPEDLKVRQFPLTAEAVSR